METNYDYDQRRLLEVHEKALQYNSTDFMSDPELMAISFGISLTNARILCYQVLENSQKKIKSITIEELTKIKGIGRRKATQIKSITDLAFRVMSSETRSMIKISRSSDIYEAVKFEFMGLEIEKFMVIYLTRSNKVLKKEFISSGGTAGTVVDQKIIFQKALLNKASSIILVHNHPSGNLKPSEHDIRITDKIVKTGRSLDLIVLDHLIISDDGFHSFADNGML